jgi:hypothetical protein
VLPGGIIRQACAFGGQEAKPRTRAGEEPRTPGSAAAKARAADFPWPAGSCLPAKAVPSDAIPSRKESAAKKDNGPTLARTRTGMMRRLARLGRLGEMRIGLVSQGMGPRGNVAGSDEQSCPSCWIQPKC